MFEPSPCPGWVKTAIDAWTEAAGIVNGRLFRSIRKSGAVWGSGITQNVVWYVVKNCARRSGINPLAPHDLRRTCARLCHAAGGELEQIQFLLGHRPSRRLNAMSDASRIYAARSTIGSRLRPDRERCELVNCPSEGDLPTPTSNWPSSVRYPARCGQTAMPCAPGVCGV